MSDPGAQYENGCCDHGWVHLCGGSHDTTLVEVDSTNPETGEPDGKMMVEQYVPPSMPPMTPVEGGCQTVRCKKHCSCFVPDGAHVPECSQAGV